MLLCLCEPKRKGKYIFWQWSTSYTEEASNKYWNNNEKHYDNSFFSGRDLTSPSLLFAVQPSFSPLISTTFHHLFLSKMKPNLFGLTKTSFFVGLLSTNNTDCDQFEDINRMDLLASYQKDCQMWALNKFLNNQLGWMKSWLVLQKESSEGLSEWKFVSALPLCPLSCR